MVHNDLVCKNIYSSHPFVVSGLLNFIDQVSASSKAKSTRYLASDTFRRRLGSMGSGKVRRKSSVRGIIKRSCSIQVESADMPGSYQRWVRMCVGFDKIFVFVGFYAVCVRLLVGLCGSFFISEMFGSKICCMKITFLSRGVSEGGGLSIVCPVNSK